MSDPKSTAVTHEGDLSKMSVFYCFWNFEFIKNNQTVQKQSKTLIFDRSPSWVTAVDFGSLILVNS